MTRLFNRGALDAHVSELLARVQRQATGAVFLMIDIDQFRLVNESCGCIAGDELLRQFAEMVGGTLARTDFFARLGGDKFAVVSEGQSDGTGVALHAKPVVAAECDIRINHGDLTALLYLQGYAREEFVI